MNKEINTSKVTKDDLNKPKVEKIKSKVQECNKSPKEILNQLKKSND